jgi:hypothetical protein
MKISLTAGLNEKEVEEITHAYQHSAVLRERFVKVMQDKINAERKDSLRKELYDTNWGLKQADSIGYIRALEEIISFMQEKK